MTRFFGSLYGRDGTSLRRRASSLEPEECRHRYRFDRRQHRIAGKRAALSKSVSVPPKTAAVRAALEDADAIITRSDFKLDAPLLDHAPRLRLIARMSAGLTGIDLDYATERGILVMNTPGVSAIAAAEHTLTLMLALNRNLPAVHDSLREGWWLFDRKQQVGVQLQGRPSALSVSAALDSASPAFASPWA